MQISAHCESAALAIRNGDVIAYPTEAVFGLGCDPQNPAAVNRILALKQRPVEKGLILLAATVEQLLPYLQDIPEALKAQLDQTWPGPVTWVLPANPETPDYLTGGRDTIAVRVTAYSLAAELCVAAGTAIVSTSANRSGQEPARITEDVLAAFPKGLDFILDGSVEGREKPSEIRDAAGNILR